MRLQDHPAVQRRDYYFINPRKLKIKPGYNVRDLDSPEERPKLDLLKASIKVHGVDEPLKVQMDGGAAYIIRGHRRHRAVMELIAEGHPIDSVPFLPIKGMNDADLNLDIIVGNDNRADLTQLQIAEVIRRQHVVYGWDLDRIAERLGRTKETVENYLGLLELPEKVQQQIKAGDVSATTAAKVVKEVRDAQQDPAFAAELIAANKEENKRLGVGKKGGKVTAKTLKRDKPKPAPKAPEPAPLPPLVISELRGSMRAEQEAIANAASISDGTPVHGPDDVDASARAGTRLPDSELTVSAAIARTDVPEDFASLQQATLAKVEQDNGWHPEQEPKLPSQLATERQAAQIREANVSQRQGLADLIAALEPFANLAHEHDFDARGDDEVIEVPIKHLKHAWIVFARVCGERDAA